MESLFSDRISDVPRSFIREILKVASDPGVISFAGGLPNPDLFPVDALREACVRAIDGRGRQMFQYSNTEGVNELRQLVADRYRQRQGLDVPIDNIMITSGSQQALDLLGKVLLNPGDATVIEQPGYLGALQAFSIYQPEFVPVDVDETGMDCENLARQCREQRVKLIYTVPNFQNPSGICYETENRKQIVQIIEGSNTLLIEDDPYHDLRFTGQNKPSFYELAPDRTILLGSWSKTVVPGMRLGWVVAPLVIMKKLLVAKQATDLHTSNFSQYIMLQYLQDNDIDRHIEEIIQVYGRQRQAMVESIGRHFPSQMTYTKPDGGMFLWAQLPPAIHAMRLFEQASKQGVVFVPGDPFYTHHQPMNTLRLSFSCVNEQTIEQGIARMGKALSELMA